MPRARNCASNTKLHEMSQNCHVDQTNGQLIHPESLFQVPGLYCASPFRTTPRRQLRGTLLSTLPNLVDLNQTNPIKNKLLYQPNTNPLPPCKTHILMRCLGAYYVRPSMGAMGRAWYSSYVGIPSGLTSSTQHQSKPSHLEVHGTSQA